MIPESRNPGAPASATGAQCKSLNQPQHAAGAAGLATHFWDPLSHSVQPIGELGAVLA
ncbi:hypothetical protein [Rubellimicrobium mesophilum]|uniref:hypothetical protein n=1 Tax=Rubellimicrobium mesophilum TaxID=1123067 RepID=UPI0012E1520F|nr:hypothetical protein [Rubellimicrobium mesophilum]